MELTLFREPDEETYISVIQDVLGISAGDARRLYKTVSKTCELLDKASEEGKSHYTIKVRQ